MNLPKISLILLSLSNPLLATTLKTITQPGMEQHDEGYPEDYFMQEKFLTELNEDLNTLPGDPNAVVAVGGTGVGKSTAINALLFHKFRYEKQKVASKPVQVESKSVPKKINVLPDLGIDFSMYSNQDSSSDEDSLSDKQEEQYVEKLVLYEPNKGCNIAKMGQSQIESETKKPSFYRHARPYPEGILITGCLRTGVLIKKNPTKVMDLTRLDETIMLCLRSYVGYISGYYDTPGFNDSKNRLTTCLLNNFLLHKTPRTKAILLVYNFSSLKLEKSSVFKMTLMDNIMKLFKPQELYKDNGNIKQLDSKKLQILLENVFILFTHVGKKKLTRKHLNAEYFDKLIEYNLSHREVVENYNFGVILTLIKGMKNCFLMHPVNDLKSHRFMQCKFGQSPGIDQSKFAFIGSPKDRDAIITLTQYHIQKAFDHMNILEGAEQRVLSKQQEIAKIEQEMQKHLNNISNLQKDTSTQKEALKALKEENEEELKDCKEELEKVNIEVEKLKAAWEEASTLLDEQEPDLACWDDSLTFHASHQEMKTKAFLSGLKGAVAGGGVGGVILGTAAVAAGAAAAPIAGAGVVIGGIWGIAKKVKNFKDNEKKGKIKPNTKEQIKNHIYKVGTPIVGYECTFKSSQNVVWHEAGLDKEKGIINIAVDLNHCLHEQEYKLTLRIKRLKKYFVEHKDRIQRMQRQVSRDLAAYQEKQEEQEDLIHEIQKLSLSIESLTKNKIPDIEQTLIAAQEQLKSKTNKLFNSKNAYQEQKKNILHSFGFLKQQKTGLTVTEKICRHLPVECFYDHDIATKSKEHTSFLQQYDQFKNNEQAIDLFCQKLNN